VQPWAIRVESSRKLTSASSALRLADMAPLAEVWSDAFWAPQPVRIRQLSAVATTGLGTERGRMRGA
jgi:hypothetical protein